MGGGGSFWLWLCLMTLGEGRLGRTTIFDYVINIQPLGHLHISANTCARDLKLINHLGGIILSIFGGNVYWFNLNLYPHLMVWLVIGNLPISANTCARNWTFTYSWAIYDTESSNSKKCFSQIIFSFLLKNCVWFFDIIRKNISQCIFEKYITLNTFLG